MKHTKGKGFERLAFDSLFELTDFISLKDNRHRDAENASTDGSESFTGTKDMEQALSLFESGDAELMEAIDERDVKANDVSGFVENVKRSFVNDVVGFIPNVANAVMGIPTNMIRMNKVYHKQKILNIAINIAVSSGVEKDDMIKNASIMYAAVDSLEKQGYRCNVWVTEVAYGRDVKHTFTVRVKTDGQPFNRLKMAFPMANPSMLRRFGFAINERSKHWIGGGYGQPIHGKEAEKEIKETLGFDNVYVIDLMKLKSTGIKGLKQGALDLEIGKYKGDVE